jgi:UPF0716 protein FxsA
MRPVFVFFALLAWPLAEIAGFVLVGDAIGVWPTLGLVILTGLLGAFLMRQQGIHLLRKLQEESRSGGVPAGSLIDGAMVVVAGILLLLPGFLTDIIGLALFLPVVRRFLWSRIGKRFVVTRSYRESGFRHPTNAADNAERTPSDAQGKVVDLDDDEFHRDGNPNAGSPWAKGDDEPR